MTEHLRPDSDDTLGNWRNHAGAAVLHSAIGEATADDATYIRSGDLLISSPDTCKIHLKSEVAALPCTVRYRYKKAGSDRVDLTVRLKQGGTEVASWTHQDIGTSVTAASQVVAAGISNFNSLFLEFAASSTGRLSGQPRGLLLLLTQA